MKGGPRCSLNLLAVFDYHQGDYQKAMALLEETIRTAEDAGLRRGAGRDRAHLAEVMAMYPRDHEHSGPLVRAPWPPLGPCRSAWTW